MCVSEGAARAENEQGSSKWLHLCLGQNEGYLHGVCGKQSGLFDVCLRVTVMTAAETAIRSTSNKHLKFQFTEWKDMSCVRRLLAVLLNIDFMEVNFDLHTLWFIENNRAGLWSKLLLFLCGNFFFLGFLVNNIDNTSIWCLGVYVYVFSHNKVLAPSASFEIVLIYFQLSASLFPFPQTPGNCIWYAPDDMLHGEKVPWQDTCKEDHCLFCVIRAALDESGICVYATCMQSECVL